MLESGDAASVIVERDGLKQTSDTGAIEAEIAQLEESDKQAFLSENNALNISALGIPEILTFWQVCLFLGMFIYRFLDCVLPWLKVFLYVLR